MLFTERKATIEQLTWSPISKSYLDQFSFFVQFVVTQCTKNGPPNNNYKNNLYGQTKLVNYAQISNKYPAQ